VVGQSVFALCQTALGMAALIYGPTRRAALAALGHYWVAALAFAVVLLTAAWQAGLLGAPHGALNPFAAQTAKNKTGGSRATNDCFLLDGLVMTALPTSFCRR